MRVLEFTCALDRKSTRLNSSHTLISYAVFCLKKKKKQLVRRTQRECDRHVSTGLTVHSVACSPRRLSVTPAVLLSQVSFACFFFFFLMIRRPPRSPLFPSTPLSRSGATEPSSRGFRASRSPTDRAASRS